jgi:hypothetical protein
LPFQALNLRDPILVQAETSGHNKDSFPKWSVITFEFGPLGDRGPVTFKWYDGGKRPSEESLGVEKLESSGTAIVGDKATLYSPKDYGSEFTILGEVEQPEVDYVISPGHFTEWVEAIRGGAAAMSNFPDVSGPLTETILLGNLAVWAAAEAGSVGKNIQWDAESLTPTNAPELTKIVKPEFRVGYEI